MGREWRTSGGVERVIDAPADVIYRVIADVTSTGERSGECRRVEWLDNGPRQAVVGARFRGHNRSRLARWSRVCEILEAEPCRAFAFRTVPERRDPSRADSTVWRYELEPEGSKTRVRHSYDIVTPPRPFFKALYGLMLPHHRDMRPAMTHTLDALAAAVETAATPPR